MCQSRISQPTNLEQSEKHIDNHTVGEIIARQKDAYSNKTEETFKFVVLVSTR